VITIVTPHSRHQSGIPSRLHCASIGQTWIKRYASEYARLIAFVFGIRFWMPSRFHVRYYPAILHAGHSCMRRKITISVMTLRFAIGVFNTSGPKLWKQVLFIRSRSISKVYTCMREQWCWHFIISQILYFGYIIFNLFQLQLQVLIILANETKKIYGMRKSHSRTMVISAERKREILWYLMRISRLLRGNYHRKHRLGCSAGWILLSCSST